METERIAITEVDLPIGSIISIEARLYPAVVWGAAEGVIVKEGDQYILKLPELKKEKAKFIWRIECMMCETTVHIDAEKIISTDQAAEFIKEPKYTCGKCRSVCVVRLVEKEQPNGQEEGESQNN